jgi:hypothetical protein
MAMRLISRWLTLRPTGLRELVVLTHNGKQFINARNRFS